MSDVGNTNVSCSRRYRTGQLYALQQQPRFETYEVGEGSAQAPPKKSKSTMQKTVRAESSQHLPRSPYTLPTPKVCEHCQAKKFPFESPGFCCANGQVYLPSNTYPAEMRRLLTSMEEDAKHFRTHIRAYNNFFAFSSLGGEIDAETVNGIHVFILHGQIYHYVPDLLPGKKKPRYLQLYFYDGQYEMESRTSVFDNLREDVLKTLMELTELNPYAKFFRSLKDIQVTEQTQITINKKTVADQRTMNAPTCDEVAAIWPDNSSSSESESPHILVSGKSNKSHRIKHFFGCYDPLQYPILNLYGESGWTQGILKKNEEDVATGAPDTGADPVWTAETAEELLFEESIRAAPMGSRKTKHVSCREYYSYKLQMRPNNLLLRAGRCLQQYIVDMYVKVENTRLDFFRNNQKTIRAELYQGIVDSVATGECIAANVGRRVILPPTFIGGPRDLKRRYLNAMALVHKFGKPDLFITMTCNANWPEIKQELEQGEEAQNRPDLVARVFHSKLKALKKYIVNKKIFGEVAALIYVVEFQKRGLPHAHFLIILKPQWKIKCPADYDKFVSAEFPPKSNNYLRQIVTRSMLHGPCGVLNPQCPCMLHEKTKGECKAKYPKLFSDVTTSNNDGYPVYRRRDDGECEKKHNCSLDNRWVIPYNAYLLSLFNCHLNVEICSSIKAVKYLYKYVYKGHDRVAFNVGPSGTAETIDEIKQFQDGRYVSPCEAAWRIFRFDLFEAHPPVLPLQVHLPNMQTLQIRPHEDLDEIMANPRKHRTPLTEYFRVNSETGGTPWLYGEFPEHYRWDASRKRWCSRINNSIAVGRLTFVVPSEGERYFLRLLLSNVRGATSFESLMTVGGYKCKTFQEAALKLNLLEEDDAIELCLKEACESQMPHALRRLFATVLFFCQPSNPTQLWETYYSELSADFAHQAKLGAGETKQRTIREIELCLEAMGKSLKEFGLDHLLAAEDDPIRRTRDIIDALDAPIPEECVNCRNLLNRGQKAAFDEIIRHVREEKPGAFFIDGPGGTGKTFLYNALYAEVRMMNKIVLPTATSGIAAANIPSGRTAHSRFKIPLDTEACLACDVPKQGSLAALLREASLIIWDEASMARRENVESLNSLLKDLCDSPLLFGGKLIVFGGDFRQVLPVLPRKSSKEAAAASLVSSSLWSRFKKFHLTENIRAREDVNFAAFLLALGNGELQIKENQTVAVPPELIQVAIDEENPINTVTAYGYPSLSSIHIDPSEFTKRAILTPLNEDVDFINSAMLEKFPGEQVIYKSFDTTIDDNCSLYPTEFINKLSPGGMSPHELRLKPNCPVILLRNILPSSGLCNGTRLICKKFYPNLIECVIKGGHHSGQMVFIPRIKLRPSSNANFPFQFQRVQFPIKLSFAMTINKAQGQTLEQVVVYLPRPCFSTGQLYVALSRAKRSSNVKVILDKIDADGSAKSLRNVVSYDVLQRAGIRRLAANLPPE